MRKGLLFMLLILLMAAPGLFAAEQEDQHQHLSCSYCGMNRVKFAHSRMLITYADGSSVGTCSLRCAAVELASNIDKGIARIEVGDFDSRQLIDAEAASWVLGGEKPGVMTMRAKWAFADSRAAQAFIKKHGGTPVDFDTALEASYADMYKDTQRIRNKRKMMKKGMSHDKEHGHDDMQEQHHEKKS